MKKFIKYFALSLIMISVSVLVSGCSSRTTTTEETRPFVIWGFDDEDYWKPIIKDIKKDLGAIEIEYIKKELNGSYENDALNSILSGMGPDVWAVPNDWVYRHKDKLEPMPEETYASINYESYVNAVEQACLFNGASYCNMAQIDTLVVYFNKKIFDEAREEYVRNNPLPSRYFGESDEKYNSRPEVMAYNSLNEKIQSVPKNWDNFREAAKILTKKNGNNIVRSGAAIGSTGDSAFTELLYLLILQHGTTMTDPDYQVATFNNPTRSASGDSIVPSKYAFEYLNSFVDPSSKYYSWNNNSGKDADFFAQGKAAMMIGFSSLENYFLQNYPTFEYEKAEIPQINTQEDNPVNYFKSIVFTVPKYSTNDKSISWQIASRARISAKGYSDVNKPDSEGFSSFSEDINQKQSITATSWVKGRYPTHVDYLFKNYYDKYSNGTISSEEAINSLSGEITTSLRKDDW